MPFRSEKQRRFLWAAHPDIAKRWAHEYPQKKKLPLYAHEDGKDTEKTPVNKDSNSSKAAEATMTPATKQNKTVSTVGLRIYNELSKKAESAAVKVNVPHSEKPTAAGDEHISVKRTEENNPGAEVCDNNENAHVSPLMAKLSVVLSQKIQQAIADDEAAQANAAAQQVPQNAGLKSYPVGAPTIPPPMGSAPTPAPASQAQAPTVQAQGTMPPVGGGSNPSANPINSYGALSVNGDINGNAAFGSPGGSKTAGKLGLWGRIRAKKERGEKPAQPGDKDYPAAKSWKKVTGISEKKSAEDQACSCGCGDTIKTCKCGPECSCRKPGGSCYTGEKEAGTPAWQRAAGKNSEGGLNAKGRASYNKATGGNLKAPVTESNPKGDRAKRQNSFCARMCGMKKHETGSDTKKDPESRINKALRKWNCKCSSAMEFGMKMAAPTMATPVSKLIPTFQQAAREGLSGMRNRFKILENMFGVRERLLSGDLYPMPPLDKHINVVNRGSTHAADVGRVLQRMLKHMRVPADKIQETVGGAPIAWLPTDKRILGNRPQLKQSAASFGPGEQTGADIGSLMGVPGAAGGAALGMYLDNPANINALKFTHNLNNAKHTALDAVSKATGMTRPLSARLSHMGSKAVLKALQFLPKSNLGRGAALAVGLPLAGLFGGAHTGMQAGRAIGRQFDTPNSAK